MKKFKETKVGKFIIEYKEAILVTSGIVVVGAASIALGTKFSNSIEIKEPDLLANDIPEIDLGRHCLMKFFDEETGDQIGIDIPCYESFVRDMMDVEIKEF